MHESEETVTIELNPRERRLYDRFRTRLVERPPGSSSGMRDIVLLLPDLSVLLVRLMRDDRVPMRAKAIAMLGVGYLLSPIDLLPGLIFGPIVLLDDALVVALALSSVLNHVHPDVVRSHWSGQGDALEAIQRVTLWCESLFTHRVRNVFRGLLR